MSDSNDLDTYSWEISTLAPQMQGRRPTAHFVVDSRYTPAELLTILESQLYGTEEELPSLPTSDELIGLFTNWT